MQARPVMAAKTEDKHLRVESPYNQVWSAKLTFRGHYNLMYTPFWKLTFANLFFLAEIFG